MISESEILRRIEDLENAMNQVCPFAWQRVSTPAQSAEKPAPLSTSWSVNDSKPKVTVEEHRQEKEEGDK